MQKFNFWKSWISNPQSDCEKECYGRIIAKVKFGIGEFPQSIIHKCRNRVVETLLQKGEFRNRVAKTLLQKGESRNRVVETLLWKGACGNLSCRIEPAEAELHNRIAGEEVFRHEVKFRVC